ncbi:hypothetical protein E3O62_11965 [Cryobacterium sp. TMT2-15-1]|uniref:hypothetical protein n=1 Tax=Cryobacterium sp. TMT2-15-1 TaxID=1259246 RepID=UPI00106B618C|nr:hypothetical protein [Cryobacterium sp. TMT2-15-1]TFC56889.1 hypothetical protein E3O62_11965 [Cryobacterium sp. TMT2-15-1]
MIEDRADLKAISGALSSLTHDLKGGSAHSSGISPTRVTQLPEGSKEVVDRTPLRLTLIENAYDSLNESLGYVEKAAVDPTRWKFAVLNLVHAVELVIKQRLFNEHALLIWENIDQPGKNTASLGKALTRLSNIHVGVQKSDLEAISTAIKWRNNITHYEVDLIAEEVRENYLLIFEFLDGFHHQHFSGSLSEHIDNAHVQTAMDLVESFNKEFIEYRGRMMHRRWPRRLVAAQQIVVLSRSCVEYARLRWGAETHWSTWMSDDEPLDYCPDCAAGIADLHGPYCDQEECPSCGGQLLSCECEFDDSEIWGLEADLEPGEEAIQTAGLATIDPHE